MIRLGTTDLTALGLLLKKAPEGLWDWPKLKTEGVNWPDSHYTEALSRAIDYQYEARTISLDCYAYAHSWTALKIKIDNLVAALTFDGLKMLCPTAHSKRGYMVRLVRSTLFKPNRYFVNNTCVAEFTIQFEEPQPFNIQFYFEEPTTVTLPEFSLSINNMDKSLSIASDGQKFVTFSFMGESQEINIEQDRYRYNGSLTFTGGVPYPVVITGEVDALQSTAITASLTPKGIDLANLFLRHPYGQLIIG